MFVKKAYFWGKLSKFHSSYDQLLLVQYFPNEIVFNYTGVATGTQFYVLGIKPDFNWDVIGTLPTQSGIFIKYAVNYILQIHCNLKRRFASNPICKNTHKYRFKWVSPN